MRKKPNVKAKTLKATPTKTTGTQQKRKIDAKASAILRGKVNAATID